jgi:hypothetical protein
MSKQNPYLVRYVLKFYWQTESAVDFVGSRETVALTHVKQQQCIWQIESNASLNHMYKPYYILK